MADLTQLLEDEIVVARPAAGEAVIDEREEEREISKRALIHIRLPQLRVMAENLGLSRSGDLEEVVDRIARAFRGDQDAIARLIVQYETEPPPERRFSTRVFQLAGDEHDPPRVRERMSYSPDAISVQASLAGSCSNRSMSRCGR